MSSSMAIGSGWKKKPYSACEEVPDSFDQFRSTPEPEACSDGRLLGQSESVAGFGSSRPSVALAISVHVLIYIGPKVPM